MGAHQSKHRDEDHVCPVHDLAENASSPLYGDTSFYDFNKILSGSCATFACGIMLVHIIRHANHLSNPGEQVKIMRIALLIPLNSLFSFLSICYPAAKVYLLPWLDVFQAHALASFFLLMCEFVSPSDDQRTIFFAAMAIPDKKAPDGGQDGLAWYRKRWILIFQYPVVAFAAAVLTDVTEAIGIYCQYETKPYWAKLWITVARDISVAMAIFSVIAFAITLRPHLAGKKPLAKLIAFKLIVALSFVQDLTFWILDIAKALKPTSTLTYADLHMGIPSMLSCIEMVPICLLIAWVYPLSPYLLRCGRDRRTPAAERGRATVDYPRSYQGGPLGVWGLLAILSPRENIECLVFAFRM
ncbi:organic solute transporter Ostalpha-domain-containing protein, partial [Phialemonium atrogriseum]